MDLAGFCREPECLGGDVEKLRGFVQLQPGFDRLPPAYALGCDDASAVT